MAGRRPRSQAGVRGPETGLAGRRPTSQTSGAYAEVGGGSGLQRLGWLGGQRKLKRKNLVDFGRDREVGGGVRGPETGLAGRRPRSQNRAGGYA